MGRELSFPSKSLFSEENTSFVDSVPTLFFKDHILLELTQSSIEIDVTVVQKHVFLNFIENYGRLKWKRKKIDVIIPIIIGYAWLCLKEQDSEQASCSKYPKLLHMTKFWIWQGRQYVNIPQHSEYARMCLERVLNIS